jgi:hypothetical protein
MSHRITRLSPIIFSVVVSSGLLSWTATTSAQSCDPGFVTQNDLLISVSPTGSDDTANLQCAIDTAVALPGASIKLEPGTFHTAQLVAEGLHGRLMGSGQGKTTLVNLPALAYDEYWMDSMPSTTNVWPSLLAFVGGDFEVSDLAIRIVGDEPMVPPPGLELYTALGDAIVIVGTVANARFVRVTIEGEARTDPDGFGFGSNVWNGIFYHGWWNDAANALSGTFRVTQSTVRNVGDGIPTSNLKDADVLISGNVIEPTSYGASTADLVDSRIEFSSNRVSLVGDVSYAGFYYYGGESYRSTIRIKDNKIRGYVGIAFEQSFNEPMDCRLQANNVSEADFIGIWLGAGTTGCYVIGGSTKTTVVDDGEGNVLVGVNNMGSGLGPGGGGNR